jgi:hypothetical protein
MTFASGTLRFPPWQRIDWPWQFVQITDTQPFLEIYLDRRELTSTDGTLITPPYTITLLLTEERRTSADDVPCSGFSVVVTGGPGKNKRDSYSVIHWSYQGTDAAGLAIGSWSIKGTAERRFTLGNARFLRFFFKVPRQNISPPSTVGTERSGADQRRAQQ